MPVYASIDLGTNSLRALIARVRDENIIPLKTYQKITRIGEGLRRTGYLQENAKQRTLAALHDCSKLLKELKVTKVAGVATSAIRDAADGEEFLRYIEKETGIALEVISGIKEAQLSFVGAVAGLQEIGREKAVVLDVGGGSTELTYLLDGGITARSHQLGAVRCTENGSTLLDMKRLLGPTLREIIANPGEKILIGVGGTITTLAAVKKKLHVYNPEEVHGTRLSRADIQGMLHYLAALPLPERKKVTGLQPERADIIVAGTRILWVILDNLQAGELIVSETDLLYGLISTQLRQSSLCSCSGA